MTTAQNKPASPSQALETAEQPEPIDNIPERIECHPDDITLPEGFTNGRVSQRDQQICVLKAVGYSNKQISALTDLTDDNIRQILHRSDPDSVLRLSRNARKELRISKMEQAMDVFMDKAMDKVDSASFAQLAVATGIYADKVKAFTPEVKSLTIGVEGLTVTLD